MVYFLAEATSPDAAFSSTQILIFPEFSTILFLELDFTFTAKPGMHLSVITMFGQSNDWFYALSHRGIELFKNGKAISGDITSEFMLYDAGTEVNEEPGIGPNQAPRQSAPNTGTAENGKVHLAKESTFFTRTGQLLRVTIMPEGSMAKM